MSHCAPSKWDSLKRKLILFLLDTLAVLSMLAHDGVNSQQVIFLVPQ